MHRTCRTRSEEMGSFLFHGNCLEEKPDADTQVSSVFGIGCEDVNFVFPDPRGRSGKLIIFCRPTARPGYQGGRGREPGKAGRAQPGQAKPGQTEPGQAGPSPWGPSRAGPSPLEPNRAGPSPWGRAVPPAAQVRTAARIPPLPRTACAHTWARIAPHACACVPRAAARARALAASTRARPRVFSRAQPAGGGPRACKCAGAGPCAHTRGAGARAHTRRATGGGARARSGARTSVRCGQMRARGCARARARVQMRARTGARTHAWAQARAPPHRERARVRAQEPAQPRAQGGSWMERRGRRLGGGLPSEPRSLLL